MDPRAEARFGVIAQKWRRPPARFAGAGANEDRAMINRPGIQALAQPCPRLLAMCLSRQPAMTGVRMDRQITRHAVVRTFSNARTLAARPRLSAPSPAVARIKPKASCLCPPGCRKQVNIAWSMAMISRSVSAVLVYVGDFNAWPA